MAMCLSFAEQFFSGDGSVDLYEMGQSDRPTSVIQAILSLPLGDRIQIARDLLKARDPLAYAKSESFPFDVLERVRQTDTCDGCESPVTVWIDDEGLYTIDVYE
jgi:hypothetical protein